MCNKQAFPRSQTFGCAKLRRAWQRAAHAQVPRRSRAGPARKSHRRVSQASLTGVSHRRVSQACLTGVSHRRVSQASLTGESHRRVSQATPTRKSLRRVSQASLPRKSADVGRGLFMQRTCKLHETAHPQSRADHGESLTRPCFEACSAAQSVHLFSWRLPEYACRHFRASLIITKGTRVWREGRGL